MLTSMRFYNLLKLKKKIQHISIKAQVVILQQVLQYSYFHILVDTVKNQRPAISEAYFKHQKTYLQLALANIPLDLSWCLAYLAIRASLFKCFHNLNIVRGRICKNCRKIIIQCKFQAYTGSLFARYFRQREDHH